MGRIQAEGPFQVQLTQFPLVALRSPSAAVYDHVNVRSVFDCLDRALVREQPFVVMFDARGVPNVDEPRRREFFQLLQEKQDTVQSRVLAFAAVVSSPFERGIVTAFVWLAGLPVRVRLFTSEPCARAWLRAQYERAMDREELAYAQ